MCLFWAVLILFPAKVIDISDIFFFLLWFVPRPELQKSTKFFKQVKKEKLKKKGN